MTKLLPVIYLLVLSLNALFAQPDFPGLVEGAFGTDQELINGIQFSNHYGQIDGHPYYQDEHFKDGFVVVADQLYEHMKLRYNLYSQRVEIEYLYTNGNQVQFMSVPAHVSSFSIGNRIFKRMHFENETPAYYQVVSSGKNACYIGWKKDKRIARNDSNRAYRFSPPIRTYRLQLGRDLIPFHNRKTFVGIFPEELQGDILKLIRKLRYSFKNSEVDQLEEMIISALGIYEILYLP